MYAQLLGDISNQFTPRHTNSTSQIKGPDPEGKAEKLKKSWEQEVRRHGAKDEERQGEQWKNSKRLKEKKQMQHWRPGSFPTLSLSTLS